MRYSISWWGVESCRKYGVISCNSNYRLITLLNGGQIRHYATLQLTPSIASRPRRKAFTGETFNVRDCKLT